LWWWWGGQPLPPTWLFSRPCSAQGLSFRHAFLPHRGQGHSSQWSHGSVRLLIQEVMAQLHPGTLLLPVCLSLQVFMCTCHTGRLFWGQEPWVHPNHVFFLVSFGVLGWGEVWRTQKN
jgi:hypothetical protein